jgi:hypothetical protein
VGAVHHIKTGKARVEHLLSGLPPNSGRSSSTYEIRLLPCRTLSNGDRQSGILRQPATLARHVDAAHVIAVLGGIADNAE